jgi:hypothetical protein
VLFYDGITIGNNKIWLISTGKNFLIEIDQVSGKILKYSWIPTKYDTLIPYRFLTYYCGKIILLPYDETAVLIYDISTEYFERIEIEPNFFESNEFCRFAGFKIINEKIYMYGVYSRILILDMHTKKMKSIDMKKYIPQGNEIEPWMWGEYYYKNGKIKFVPQSCPCIVTLSCENNEITFEKIESENLKHVDYIGFWHGKLYYGPRNGKEQIVCYDLQTKEKNTIYIGRDCGIDYRAFGYAVIENDRIFALFRQSSEMLVIDLKNNGIDIIESLPQINSELLGSGYPYEFAYRNACTTNDKHIVAINAWTKDIVDLDTTDMKLRTKQVKDNGKNVDWSIVYKTLNCRGGLINEHNVGMLEAYVETIANM